MNINIGGLNINYKISGPDGSKDAPVLVVLQGWGTGMEIYDSVAAAGNDRYRVVQFDLPVCQTGRFGNGRSKSRQCRLS